MKLGDYIWWDATLKRWDVTNLAICEQTRPEVEELIKLVIRSWFIPASKEVTNESIANL